jgi:hypothetical protein
MGSHNQGVRKPASTLPHLRKKKQIRATAVRGQANPRRAGK